MRFMLLLVISMAGIINSAAAETPAVTGKSFAETNSIEKNWPTELRSGGYVLYFRHALRDKWDNFNGYDQLEIFSNTDGAKTHYKAAVCLNVQGKSDAKLLRDIFQIAKITATTVISSPSCRARQTARIVFGTITKTDPALIYRDILAKKDVPVFAEKLRRLMLTQPIAAGSNLALVGHASTLRQDGPLVITNSDSDLLKDVSEGGFHILERSSGQLFVVARFDKIADFVAKVIQLDPNQKYDFK